GVDPAPVEPGELVGDHLRVDDDPVADQAELPGVEDPRRDQVELVCVAAPDDRVARVVAALVADDDVRAFGDEVGDLPLTLIAPLGAHDYEPRYRVPQCS